MPAGALPRIGRAGAMSRLVHLPVSTRLAMVTYFLSGFLRGGDRFGERTLVAHFGELDQHRQIDAGQHFDLGPAHHRDGKIGGRAAEHVGQDGDAVAAVDAPHRFDDVLAALFDVVVGADGDGLDLALRSNHVLQGGAELNSQPPVGHKHKTNHGTPRGRVPGAPHERVHIMTIRSPGARGIPSKFRGLLHCSRTSRLWRGSLAGPAGGYPAIRARSQAAVLTIMVNQSPIKRRAGTASGGLRSGRRAH